MQNTEYPKHVEIYDECMRRAYAAKSLYDKTAWIHLTDAVESGSISPREAYEAFRLPYLPAWLTTRKSRYEHLL